MKWPIGVGMKVEGDVDHDFELKSGFVLKSGFGSGFEEGGFPMGVSGFVMVVGGMVVRKGGIMVR